MKALPLAAALALIASPVMADGADDLIKYRKNLMKAVGGATQAISAILKGDAGRREDLPALTAILAAASDPGMVNAAFEPNTAGQGIKKTTSAPAIWEDWERFQEISVRLGEATQAAAAKGADLGLRDMRPVFIQCKACHDDFREK